MVRSCQLDSDEVWQMACDHLRQTDPVLSHLLDQVGPGIPRLTSRGNAFETLVRSVLGQQISVKAAQSIWDRLVLAADGQLTPDWLLAQTVETLRALGLSQRKVGYVQDLALNFESHGWMQRDWASESDPEIVQSLVQIKGIGPWTAQMFLMFHLKRPDVLPIDDLGLLKGAQKAYGWPDDAGVRQRLAVQSEAWKPWRTVATWYIWRSLEPVPVSH